MHTVEDEAHPAFAAVVLPLTALHPDFEVVEIKAFFRGRAAAVDRADLDVRDGLRWLAERGLLRLELDWRERPDSAGLSNLGELLALVAGGELSEQLRQPDARHRPMRQFVVTRQAAARLTQTACRPTPPRWHDSRRIARSRQPDLHAGSIALWRGRDLSPRAAAHNGAGTPPPREAPGMPRRRSRGSGRANGAHPSQPAPTATARRARHRAAEYR